MKAFGMRGWASVALLGMALQLGGCATVEKAGARLSDRISKATTLSPGQKKDPWEEFNRKVFGFNEALDDKVLKPVATVYSDVVPSLVRAGVDNFFGNFYDGWSAINHLLQGKGQTGLEMGMRFMTNIVFGLGGILDPAAEMGLERRSEDFGQTLGKWGFASGPYLVLPLLGPSTVRDVVGMPLDLKASPATLINSGGSRLAVNTVQAVNLRALLLGASRMLDDIALDKYSFVRDAYLARRRSLIFDGDAPEADEPPETKP